MATVKPGIGRNVPEHHKWTPNSNYAVHTDWPFEDTKTWTRRTANRPHHLRSGTPVVLKRQRVLFASCSTKYKNLSAAQKKVWSTICVKVVRIKHKGSTHEWTVKGRLAFMSSCLLGYVRSCDKMDNLPDVPPDTLINILMFHLRIIDINLNPINKAKITILSKTLKEKDGSDKTMYNQATGVDGYPPDFGMAVNFQPYNLFVDKTYKSQKKTVDVTTDTTVELIMC
jgi:hypothetical protein